MAEMQKKTSSWDEKQKTDTNGQEFAPTSPSRPAPSRPLPLRPSGFAPNNNSAIAASGDLAAQLAHSAEDMLGSRLEKEAGKGAQDLRQLADALRQTSRQIEDNVAAPYVSKAAAQIDRVAQLLRDTNPREVVRGTESFARREPLIFLGGAFIVGIVGARFLKSSAPSSNSGGQSKTGGEFRKEGTFVEVRPTPTSPMGAATTRRRPLAP
jgi:hypothetical protein